MMTNPNTLICTSHDYTIGCLLGQGAYGQVFKGTFRKKVVAIKEMMFDRNYQYEYNCFKREIELLKILNHPNIVETLGIVDEPKSLVLIMEYVPFGSLRELIKNQELKKEMRIRVCYDISIALSYLHHLNIIHRDIKSGNVLLTTKKEYKSGIVAKLCDFESSCYEKDSIVDKKIGTPIYMPPEQWNSKRLTKESDIYSFGILCYECIDNHLPYDTLEFSNEWNIAMFVCQNKRLPKPKECDEYFWKIITGCWCNEPSQRIRINEIIKRLKKVI
ncbi:serine threonine protein kinase putative [Entamoeba histolytica]|uniref:Serine threonine protein kinase putative n=1 Tax=Entamoeba histolytica TaxID=5759 RepID=A0A175JYQ7_ENTHI|nr:serine threonine protein kinase putative [Entamoeba histolytica]